MAEPDVFPGFFPVQMLFAFFQVDFQVRIGIFVVNVLFNIQLHAHPQDHHNDAAQQVH